MNDNNKWIHDLLDEQSADERILPGITDEELVTSENAEVMKPEFKAHFANRIDTNADWLKVKGHFETDRPKVISIAVQLLKYAAVLAIPFAIWSVFYFAFKEGHATKTLAITQANVIKNQPSLTLEDGSQVTLTDEINGKIKGTQIMSMNNALDYSEVITGKPTYNILTVPRGRDYKLILEDGTEIWLNAESRLKYCVSFVNSTKREVFLESGEAYFKVTKNPHKPFIVHNGNMSVQVLGTSFNINAYSGVVQTTLIEGKVKINIKKSKNGVVLIPGQQAQFDIANGKLNKQTVEVYSFIAWKEGVFAFEHTSLETLMDQIGRAYDLDVIFKDEALKQLHFSGTVEKKEDVKELLDIIQKTTHLKFTIKDRRIIIEKSVR